MPLVALTEQFGCPRLGCEEEPVRLQPDLAYSSQYLSSAGAAWDGRKAEESWDLHAHPIWVPGPCCPRRPPFCP